MENPLVILRFPDLLPWERDLLQPILLPLQARRRVVEIDLPRRGEARLVRQSHRVGARYWVWARDWRRALRMLAPLAPSPVFLSVLSLSTARKPLPMLFLKHMTKSFPSHARLLVHSPLNERFFLEMERIPAAQLARIELPPPSKPLDARPRSAAPGVGTIGTFGPFTNESNLNYVMNVAHYVTRKNPSARFKIAGFGPYLGHVRRMVKELDVLAGVEVIESVTGAEIADCDVFLYTPLRNDHFGPLLHAAAAGRPVLANELPGLETLLVDGDGGFVVPVNETKPMGELALRLLDNPTMRESMGSRLRAGVQRRDSATIAAQRCEELFFGVAGAAEAARVA